MTKNQSKKDVFYSETFEQEIPEIDNKTLQSSITRLEEENNALAKTLNRLEEESSVLRAMFNNVNDELSNLKKPSLLVADIVNVIDEKNAIIKLPNGNRFYCHMSKEAENVNSGDSVLVDQKSLNILKKIDLGENFEVEKFVIIEKPQESWKEIGGLRREIQEVKEVIELPLKKPHLFEKVGIKPPKGVLLYGPPGTGKTLLAKAVAHSTNATFIEVVGSELVQKFIGEGAKLVKDIFALARRKAPTIVFIDEIDALAAVRMENGTSGEREVNRTFMQLLSELDGFKHLGDVKIIGATNRIDILDKAIIRPGRLDRLIEVGLPDEEGRFEIMKVHTKSMNLQKIDVKELVKNMDGFSGAEIQATCTEAGYFAIRENREYVTQDDFVLATEKVRFDDEDDDGAKLFG
ncbi:proteasome-activating nucleotidase [Candidatus Woesearchaeota archaeon CG10_big_fil_rev_8_21_14_0_10_36_11]|nr:MAG: proteasome-activating nucleotidase [Candidatus Woesearchaeota archaeon CG10_big_fil_rev_8_21_14_0_10_36_11]